MKYIRHIYVYQLTLSLIFSFYFSFGQQPKKISDSATISIIISGAGEGLYEKFGHAAIRIQDKTIDFDEIYNYGIFDFNGPNFYYNFSKGYMKYKLLRYPFYYALKNANKDKRSVKEQILNLNSSEKNKIFNYLEENRLPENASYFYDPFFNNCATKPKDILKEILSDKLLLSTNHINGSSLRDLMNKKIHQNTWGSFGINFALGNRLDQKATLEEYIYLPDFLQQVVANSKIKRQNKTVSLMLSSNYLLIFEKRIPKADFFNPFLFFLLILFITIFITYKNIKTNKRTRWIDVFLFGITGILGIVIVFLWFFTNHSTAPNNFNFLWAFAVNFYVAFLMLKKQVPNWIRYYIFVLVAFILIIPLIWLVKIQVFNWVLLPFFIALLIRYIYLQKALNS